MGVFFLSIFIVFFLLLVRLAHIHIDSGIQLSRENSYGSAIGDPGMKNPNARFGLEAWNFCNEVGMEAPQMGSPRMADCADLHCPLIPGPL